MAKKNKKKSKAKAPKCPQCSGKLIKIRNVDERQCRDCGHREPILQSPGESSSSSMPAHVQEPAVSEGHPGAIQGTNAKMTMDGQDVSLDGITLDPKESAKMQGFYDKMAGRSPEVVGKRDRAKAEAEHVAKIRRRPPPGDNVSRGLLQLVKVQLHCWSIGPGRGFRYGTRCPYPSTQWSKEVSGAEAFKFLIDVKRANRLKKLESGGIIEFS